MDTKKRGDLHINGIGGSNGGQFEQVTINGRGTVKSDIDCDVFDCNGVATVKGSVKSEKAKVNGKVKVEGSLESQVLDVDGTATIKENLFVEKLTVNGHVSAGGRVKGEEFQIKGLFKAGGDCEAETFHAESHFSIDGLLNADDIDVKIYGECKVKEIGGQTITVRSRETLIGSLLKPFAKTQLVTDLIEGDRIDLESTSAKVVRGNNVKIGPDCSIGVVEYTGEIVIANNASVGESRKV
ncbi:cytoplasmic protein [Bacillus sp. BRMEA1]|uniref:cytoplasmic protein n=1 Tax=Neobacillus endophyticus TaxID=2738405 RepID=UPI001565B6E3|nr:cytoplasmic protein [Neobacillus endophyticus]NRD77629.1 cytoplasmic protein [Neobacillus endophyticus]